MRRPRLVIFAKAPRLGAVKRRLGRDIGDLAALAFYRANLAELARRLGGDRRWTSVLAVTPDRVCDQTAMWPPGLARQAQGGGDLGTRLARVLRAGGGAPVIVVGSDIPEITAAHVARAFDALAGADAVFGPSGDGGFWAVGWRGARPWPPSGLAGVRWSTGHALADSRASLGRGTEIVLTDPLDDVDDAAAYARWRARTR
ncbi:MAG: glycosyltransferase [Alphaproteobacteria bacterium]|nr:glycosyltransferase [Alphaproteobacteria bacterium]